MLRPRPPRTAPTTLCFRAWSAESEGALRAQLTKRCPARSVDAIEEAIQYACKSFLDEAEGITAPGQNPLSATFSSLFGVSCRSTTCMGIKEAETDLCVYTKRSDAQSHQILDETGRLVERVPADILHSPHSQQRAAELELVHTLGRPEESVESISYLLGRNLRVVESHGQILHSSSDAKRRGSSVARPSKTYASSLVEGLRELRATLVYRQLFGPIRLAAD